MSAAWNMEETDKNIKVEVTVENGDSSFTDEFSGSITVEEAVRKTARKAGLSSVIVKTEDDEELQPADGGKTLSVVGGLTLYPKSSGSF